MYLPLFSCCFFFRKRQPAKKNKKEKRVQMHAIPEQGLKAKLSHLNFNTFIVYLFQNDICQFRGRSRNTLWGRSILYKSSNPR